MKEKKYCVYFITNIILDKHYIGYSSRLGPYPIDNLGVNGIGYCSSSRNKAFKKDQKENPDNYFYSVIDSFDTKEEALALEVELHNRYNVRVNESFYNRAKQTSIKFDTTGMVTVLDTRDNKTKQITKEEFDKHDYYVGASKGRKHTDATKKLQSDKLKGTVVVFDKVKGINCRVTTEDFYTNKNLVSPNKGKETSDATKEKISIAKSGIKRLRVTCPHCSIEGGINNMKRWHFDNCKVKLQ